MLPSEKSLTTDLLLLHQMPLQPTNRCTFLAIKQDMLIQYYYEEAIYIVTDQSYTVQLFTTLFTNRHF